MLGVDVGPGWGLDGLRCGLHGLRCDVAGLGSNLLDFGWCLAGGWHVKLGSGLELGSRVARFPFRSLPESSALPGTFLGPIIRRLDTLFGFVRQLLCQGGDGLRRLLSLGVAWGSTPDRIQVERLHLRAEDVPRFLLAHLFACETLLFRQRSFFHGMAFDGLGTRPGDRLALQEPAPASRLRPDGGFAFNCGTLGLGNGANVRRRLLLGFCDDFEAFVHHRDGLGRHGCPLGFHGERRGRLLLLRGRDLQVLDTYGLRLRGRFDRVLVDERRPTDHEPLDDLACGRGWFLRNRRH
jgi:hypothetical protein